MFKYSILYVRKIILIFFIITLFLITYNYLSLHLYKVCYLNFIYCNQTHANLFTVIYVSIIFVLILILFLNRALLLVSIKPVIIFLIFSTVIFILIYTNSIFIYFLMYEILLILTSIVVYFNSQNIRSKTITMYFILWTQLSSFILWLAVVLIYTNTNEHLFTQLSLCFIPKSTKNLITYLLLVSFSIKLPLWPFSFWLIKTHVEANTSFSIFLSGVLVKTALIGLLKFNIFFINTNVSFIFTVITLSLIFTTFSLNNQVDFKKLIAYTTVQEMSLVLFFVLFNGYNNLNLLIYFIIMHTLTSVLLFLLNDSIYIRFKTRKTKLFLGTAVVTPKLNSILVLIWLFFISIPLSFKFFFEIMLIWKLFSLPLLVLVLLLLSLQVLTLIFVTKNIITYSFGSGLKLSYDITKTELLVYLIVLLMLLCLVF